MSNSQVQTNLNGINTLTRRVNELKEEIKLVKEQADSLEVDKLTESLKDNSKAIRLNAIRIKTQRDLDFDTKIKNLKDKINKLDSKINNILSGVESNTKELEQQLYLISEIKINIAENANAIATNALDIVINSDKNRDTLGSIEVVSTKVSETEEQVKELQEGVATNSKVIDGCIIGIDRNMTTIKDVAVVVVDSKGLIAKNEKSISSNNDSIIKNAKNLELNSVQTKTNSDNVRMLRK